MIMFVLNDMKRSTAILEEKRIENNSKCETNRFILLLLTLLIPIFHFPFSVQAAQPFKTEDVDKFVPLAIWIATGYLVPPL